MEYKMATDKDSAGAGIPEDLEGKARSDWIRRALGRPSEPRNSEGVPPAPSPNGSQQPRTTSTHQDQAYQGKPKHFQ